MQKLLFFLLLCGFSSVQMSCDTKTKAEPYVELTLKEQARAALDAKNFSEAVRLYKEVVEAEPTEYEHYRFLATAYAELGGFDIVSAITGTLSDAVSGRSVMNTLSTFLPENPTNDQITSIGLATETLMKLPPEYRSYDHPEIETSSSAAQQLGFYQAAYSLVYIKKFTQVTDAGSVDISKLEEMTDADVDNILNNFESLAEAQGGTTIAKGVEHFISQLDAAPGGTRREKLLAYLEEHPLPASSK